MLSITESATLKEFAIPIYVILVLRSEKPLETSPSHTHETATAAISTITPAISLISTLNILPTTAYVTKYASGTSVSGRFAHSHCIRRLRQNIIDISRNMPAMTAHSIDMVCSFPVVILRRTPGR